MESLLLTIGAPAGEAGWSAVTDRGERVTVPARAADGWQPGTGQRVVARLGPDGGVVRVEVPGSALPLPGIHAHREGVSD